jgi:hypothetical protein
MFYTGKRVENPDRFIGLGKIAEENRGKWLPLRAK